MRAILLFLSALTISLLSVLWYAPEQVHRSYFLLTKSIRSLLYERNFTFESDPDLLAKSGLEPLALKTALIELLPRERTNLWWVTHTEDLSRMLEKSPFVEKASISPCDTLSLGCFELEVRPRVPALVAQVEHDEWTVGKDGGLIRRVSAGAFSHLPRVYGTAGGDLSPELVRARLSYVSSAIEMIRHISGLAIEQVLVERSGELRVQFQGVPFLTVFEADSHDLEVIREESRRLHELLVRFDGDPRQVKKIDLAFQRLAVVEFYEGESPLETPKKGAG
ncbi:MAG: hypothetical protein KDD55_04615 [Bdellovibrionales bacterium]|nr:hypothetical protein [Bdellovibrionales bacterium]